jgi:hypothetical protein
MYKKIILVTITSTLSSFSIKAETPPPPSFKHEFSLGVESMRYFYKEPDIHQDPEDQNAYWMSDTGNLYGLNGSYRLTWKDALFIQPEGRIVKGTHDYRTGQKETIYGKTKNKIPVLLYEPRLIVGGKIPVIQKMTLSPYTGIGYRFKSDAGDEVKTNRGNPLAYRKSNYVYIPLGASVDYNINDIWSLSLKGEYDWMIKGWQYTRNSTILPKPITNQQPNGYGLKGEASVSYLYEKVKFSVSPYFNYWNIRNSKYVVYAGGRAREPYNVTFESGIKLSVAF